jgi:hypothetical protein
MKELDIRYSEVSDGQHLIKWLMDEEVRKWYPPTTEKEVVDFSNNWIGFSRFKASLTAIYQNEICGIGTLFLMPYKKVAHQAMVYMAFNPLINKEEIREDLLKNLINLAQNYFKLEFVVAEVFEGSMLIELFEQMHFECFAKQKNFVKDEGIYRSRILYQQIF